MYQALLLGSLGREALRVAVALVVVILLAVVFGIAAVAAIWGALTGARAAPERAAGGPMPPIARPVDLPPGAPTPGVVAVARQYLGMPYAWGGANPSTSFDCSGLVQWSYGQLGVRLPRTAQMQYQATARVETADLKPGDLVFFGRTYPDPNDWITHVGIYVGDGQMINAPVEGKPISVMPVFTGFWGAHYAGGGRVNR